MSSDLDTYKRNRINELNNIFNSNVARLNSALHLWTFKTPNNYLKIFIYNNI